MIIYFIMSNIMCNSTVQIYNITAHPLVWERLDKSATRYATNVKRLLRVNRSVRYFWLKNHAVIQKFFLSIIEHFSHHNLYRFTETSCVLFLTP